MVLKNDLLILEFDDNRDAKINPIAFVDADILITLGATRCPICS